MPLEEYKLSNFSNLYKKRIFFLNNDNQYHIHGKEMLDKLLLESLADMSFQINIIDTSKDFNSIKSQLLEILFNIMELNLYFKNGIIIGDIYKKYNSFKMFDLSSGEENDLALILSVFNSSILSDEEKIIKIMAFMKNIKNELMKEFLMNEKIKLNNSVRDLKYPRRKSGLNRLQAIYHRSALQLQRFMRFCLGGDYPSFTLKNTKTFLNRS
jgi:hypothetical protein